MLRSRTIPLGFFLALLLAAPTCPAEDRYADMERRKEKIDRLQDLLRIREAELKLEQLALEQKNLRRQAEPPPPPATKPKPTADSTTLRPPPPPRPRQTALRNGRLVEIFDDLVVIRLGRSSHELRKGGSLQGWTLREIGPDFVRLRRRQEALRLDLALPDDASP